MLSIVTAVAFTAGLLVLIYLGLRSVWRTWTAQREEFRTERDESNRRARETWRSFMDLNRIERSWVMPATTPDRSGYRRPEQEENL